MNINGTHTLSQFGVIKVTGTDAQQFLNKQLTANLSDMTPHQAQLAAYCSPQGRVLSSFIVLQNTTEEFLLICRQDIIDLTLKRLKMFILRSNVTLTAAPELIIHAHINTLLPEQNAASSQPWSVQKINTSTHINLSSVKNIQRQLIVSSSTSHPSEAGNLTNNMWDWLAIRSGFYMVNANTRDEFIPQMLNYESLGAISFNKGCYPGQEVVARSQFRGSVKRRLTIIQATHPLQTGGTIYDESQAPIANILTAAPAPNTNTTQWHALAVLPTQSTQSVLKIEQEPITCLPLPYSILTDF